MESFGGRLRRGCLNLHWFPTLASSKVMLRLLAGHDRPGFYLAAFSNAPETNGTRLRYSRVGIRKRWRCIVWCPFRMGTARRRSPRLRLRHQTPILFSWISTR